MKTKQIRPRRPTSKMFGIPEWHHHHSSKMTVVDGPSPIPDGSLRIEGSAAVLVIQPCLPNPGWLVSYTIHHSNPSNSTGLIWMSEADLKTAFGLSQSCAPDFGQHMIDRFGGDVAFQGKYIRFEQYLNMPGPGTGHDGDPNLSVCLSDEIKKAVGKLFDDPS